MSRQPAFHKHVFVYGSGAVALQAVNLLLLPLYTHYLETTEYGALQIIYRIGELFHICLMVQALKLAAFNLYGNANDDPSRQRTAASVTVVTLAAMLIGGLFILISGDWLAARYPAMGGTRLVICGVLTILLQSATLMPTAMMQARYESWSFVVATVGIAISHLALSAFGVAVMRWGIWGVILSLAITHGTVGLILTIRELARTSVRPDWRQVRHVVRFSAPMIPVGLLSMAMHHGDQFFLMSTHGAVAVGVYAIAYRIVQSVEMLAFEPLCQIWQPWTYRMLRAEGGRRRLGQAVTRILAVYLLAALGLVLFRAELIGLLTSQSFQGAADFIPLLVLAFFFMAASSLADASYFLTSRTGLRTIVAASTATLMLALYAYLIPRYGGMGAALSTVIGFAANYIVNLFVAQRVFRIQYEAKRVVTLFITVCTAVIIGEQLGDGGFWLVPKSLLWIGWPVFVWKTGIVRLDEKAMIGGAVRRIPWLGAQLEPYMPNLQEEATLTK